MVAVLEPTLPIGVPTLFDRELLAWAGGFFDGEGSTIAKSQTRRPGYYQLEVSVPQSGPDGVPDVLLKFQNAMLGVGRIDPQRDSAMYRWTSRGRVDAELALALMWPWLGTVKRAQARAALVLVTEQYATSRYSMKPPRYRPTFVAHASPTVSDDHRLRLAWAAGFIDAEGYFGVPRHQMRRDGSMALCPRVSASQNGAPHAPAEVLNRLLKVVGVGRIERHGDIDDFKWVAEGSRNVRHVLESLTPWLGAVKRAQAAVAIAESDAGRVRGDADRCIRGHVYDRVYMRPDGTIHRICNACDRIRDREKRTASGGTPRNVRVSSADATRVYAR